MGAGVLAEGNEDVMIIGHPGLNAVVEQNAKAAGAPAYFQELGPYLTARMLIQFNAFMPSEGPDAWARMPGAGCLGPSRSEAERAPGQDLRSAALELGHVRFADIGPSHPKLGSSVRRSCARGHARTKEAAPAGGGVAGAA